MSKQIKRYAVILALCTFAVVIGGCSSSSKYKGVYETENAALQQPLEVPPDLNQPEDKRGLELPEIARTVQTYSGYSQTQKDQPGQRVLPDHTNMRFVRDGSLFWVEIDAKPEQVWNEARDFIQKVGFEIVSEQPQIGLIETNWLENRHGVPTGWFAELFRKVYKTGLRDKYRLRIERDTQQSRTRLYIRHSGMKEVIEGEQDTILLASTDEKVLGWGIRESDPELEVEMLMRFMTYRGLDQQLAEQRIAQTDKKARSQLHEENGQTVLQVNEPFMRTWRHVEVAMDRLGYTIEDRNRAAGLYFIKLPEQFRVKSAKTGWFGGLFSSAESKPSTDQYLLVVESSGDRCTVSVRDRDAKTDDFSAVAKKILSQLQQNIL